MTQTSTDTSRIGALILAAGKGTRMYSPIPKVLQLILHEPMLRYVYDAVTPVCSDRVWTVIGHKAEMVQAAFPQRQDGWIIQNEQLGTGHALQVAWPSLKQANLSHVLVINGDTPLLPEATLRQFMSQAISSQADVAFITLSLENPGAFGRVVRKNGTVTAVIEAKDYDPAVHGADPHEINAGIYCFRLSSTEPLLSRLLNTNKSGEYYITDLIGLAAADGLSILGYMQQDAPELLGINNPVELVRSEELIRAKIVEQHAQNGIIIRAPHSVRIGPDVVIEKGVSITGPAELYGQTRIASGVVIDSHCVIHTAALGEATHIESFTHISHAVVAANCSIGPYARLRPDTVIDEKARVGNFVEMKKSHLGPGAKANHLSYVGDAVVGAKANIGAGTITCNYDGKNKHKTVIGEGAFIGSNTALVAPVSIGCHALVGAGSVITKDVTENTLALTRSEQKSRPLRNRHGENEGSKKPE